MSEQITDPGRDSVFSSLFPSSVKLPIAEYLAQRPVVSALLAGDYERCKRLADEENDLPRLIIACLAELQIMTVTGDRAPLRVRVNALGDRHVASAAERAWIDVLRVQADAHLDRDERCVVLADCRNAAAAIGQLDAASYAHLAIMDAISVTGEREHIDQLAEQLHQYRPDGYSRLHATLVQAWLAADLGDDIAHKELCLASLALLEQLPFRPVFYEMIALRESAFVAHETNDAALIDRVARRVDAVAWPSSVDYWHAHARYHVAAMRWLAGDVEAAYEELERGLAVVILQWGRLRLMAEKVKLRGLTDDAERYHRDAADLLRVADGITWTDADRGDRLLLLELAAIVNDHDAERATEFRELYRQLRVGPVRHPRSRLEQKTALGERTLSGIADAVAGNPYEALGRLGEAVEAWQKQIDVPWRAATAAYNLALFSREPADVSMALQLLGRWPRSPMTLRLAVGEDASLDPN